jgi:ABC-2 type transport system permease protein
MNLILIPIWLLSGAFWPVAGAPLLLELAMRLNPLTYGVAALREALYAGQPGELGGLPNFGFSFAIAVVFAIAMYFMAARVARNAAVS